MDQRKRVAIQELRNFVDAMSLRKFRTMGDFAEQEIITPPGGPTPNLRYRIARQPYSRSWFSEVDSHRWREHFACGPSQAGKSFQCLVIPMLYYLFEIQESVIVGVPDANMAADKWNRDFLPVIAASQYHRLLPYRGQGSKGGSNLVAVTFRNGCVMRFMSARGGDKSKAGLTSRIIGITELSDFGDLTESSDESSPYNQLLARCEAHDDQRIIFAECTVTTTTNIVWSKYLSGTASRIVVQCRGCGEWTSPEREHLVGFHESDNVIDAGENARFICPACGIFWSAEDRIQMNREHRLIHRGQSITKEGEVLGDMPKTRRFSFRWNAFHNLFKKPSTLGEREWESLNGGKEEDEVALRQFVWAMPTEPTDFETVAISLADVTNRSSLSGELTRGLAPVKTEFLTMGVDVGKGLLHWTVAATSPGATGSEWLTHIVNYGRIAVPQELGFEKSFQIAFAELNDLVEAGFTIFGKGESWSPWQVFIDANYKPEFVHAAVARYGNRYRATQGRGKGQRVSEDYLEPNKTTSNIVELGQRWHVVYLPERRCELLSFDANYYKTAFHDGLRIPPGQSGCVTIFKADRLELFDFGKQVTNEREVQDWDVKRGMVKTWRNDSGKQNHWFDSTALALVAQRFCLQQLAKVKTPANPEQGVIRPLLNGNTISGTGVSLRRVGT